jgi:hypothetical protein
MGAAVVERPGTAEGDGRAGAVQAGVVWVDVLLAPRSTEEYALAPLCLVATAATAAAAVLEVRGGSPR